MPNSPSALFVVCIALAAVALGGCGAGHRLATGRAHAPAGHPARSSAPACPGPLCPYRSVAIVGKRDEGVLRFPEALAVAANGDVYVADQYSYVVQRFTAHGRFLGRWGSEGAGPGQFGAVGGLAVSSAGDVYLVDAGHDRVEEFDATGRFVREWGSRGRRVGQFDFGAGAPGVPPGGGIAVYGDHVYVSDTFNDRVERFTLEGRDPVVLGGPGHAPGELEEPRGLAASRHELYVADAGNNRIAVFHTDGPYAREAGRLGSGDGQFTGPFDVAVGADGAVYVADDNNHRVVELTRHLHFVANLPLTPLQDRSEGLHPNFGGEEVSYPRAVAVARNGTVYVADAAANHIAVFNAAGEPLGTWGSSGRAYGQFILPQGVAATPAGGALVADTIGGRVELFDRRLGYVRTLYGSTAIVGRHLFKPVAVAVAPDRTLWVVDQENDLLRHLTMKDELVGTVGGEDASQPGHLQDPGGVAVGEDGEIYVADTGEDLIKRYSPAGALLGVWGGPGSTEGRFYEPEALAVDAAGDVYVADFGNDRVEEFSPEGTFLDAFGGPGRVPGTFHGPDGVAVDASGQVFVADSGNDRVEEFAPDGSFMRMWGTNGGAAGELSSPAGLALDCTGALLVADTGNNRIQRFGGVAPAGRCE